MKRNTSVDHDPFAIEGLCWREQKVPTHVLTELHRRLNASLQPKSPTAGGKTMSVSRILAPALLLLGLLLLQHITQSSLPSSRVIHIELEHRPLYWVLPLDPSRSAPNQTDGGVS